MRASLFAVVAGVVVVSAAASAASADDACVPSGTNLDSARVSAGAVEPLRRPGAEARVLARRARDRRVVRAARRCIARDGAQRAARGERAPVHARWRQVPRRQAAQVRSRRGDRGGRERGSFERGPAAERRHADDLDPRRRDVEAARDDHAVEDRDDERRHAGDVSERALRRQRARGPDLRVTGEREREAVRREVRQEDRIDGKLGTELDDIAPVQLDGNRWAFVTFEVTAVIVVDVTSGIILRTIPRPKATSGIMALGKLDAKHVIIVPGASSEPIYIADVDARTVKPIAFATCAPKP